MTNTEELQKVLDRLEDLSADFAEIKQDLKTVKGDINTLKTGQAVLVNDGKWIKVLYGVFSSVVIVLLATLIELNN